MSTEERIHEAAATLKQAEREVTTARAWRDLAIRDAVRLGLSEGAAAAAAGISRQQVKRVCES